MFGDSVVAIEFTLGILTKALFVGDSLIIVVVSVDAVLNKLSGRLCR